MDFESGMEVIKSARNRINEDRLYQRWILGYQMVMSFTEFKRTLGEDVLNNFIRDNRNVKDILIEVKEIMDGNF